MTVEARSRGEELFMVSRLANFGVIDLLKYPAYQNALKILFEFDIFYAVDSEFASQDFSLVSVLSKWKGRVIAVP